MKPAEPSAENFLWFSSCSEGKVRLISGALGRLVSFSARPEQSPTEFDICERNVYGKTSRSSSH
jgi:hypothetical protein